MLDHWYQKLPPSYTVGDLVDEAEKWQQAGYLDRDVFSSLSSCVSQDTNGTRYGFTYMVLHNFRSNSHSPVVKTLFMYSTDTTLST